MKIDRLIAHGPKYKVGDIIKTNLWVRVEIKSVITCNPPHPTFGEFGYLVDFRVEMPGNKFDEQFGAPVSETQLIQSIEEVKKYEDQQTNR